MNYYSDKKTKKSSHQITKYSQKDLHLKVKVRLCTEQDIENLEWFGMFYEHRNIYRLQYQRHLKQENIMLVADLKGFPVGQVWIDLCARAEDSAALIWALRIHPILQNFGLGSLLINNSEILLQSKKIYFAQLEVEKTNTKALKLYQKLGYRIFNERQETWSFDSPGGHCITGRSDLYMMIKDLRHSIPTNHIN